MSNLGNKKVMSKNLQRYMDLNHISRNDLCAAIGVKYTTLTDWIKGNTYPRIDKIEKMANYFGIRKSDLVEDHALISPDPSSCCSNGSISPSLLPDESALLDDFRELNDEGKIIAKTTVHGLVVSGAYEKKREQH